MKTFPERLTEEASWGPKLKVAAQYTVTTQQVERARRAAQRQGRPRSVGRWQRLTWRGALGLGVTFATASALAAVTSAPWFGFLGSNETESPAPSWSPPVPSETISPGREASPEGPNPADAAPAVVLGMENPKEQELPNPAPLPQNVAPGRRVKDGNRVSKTGSARMAAQLTLLREARALVQAGAHQQALDVLARLVRNHPRTPLRHELTLVRVDAWVALGRWSQAVAGIDEVLASGNILQPQRRGSLYRLQGDLLGRLGDCARGRKAYQRALGLGLAPQEQEAARRGLRDCAGKSSTPNEKE